MQMTYIVLNGLVLKNTHTLAARTPPDRDLLKWKWNIISYGTLALNSFNGNVKN